MSPAPTLRCGMGLYIRVFFGSNSSGATLQQKTPTPSRGGAYLDSGIGFYMAFKFLQVINCSSEDQWCIANHMIPWEPISDQIKIICQYEIAACKEIEPGGKCLFSEDSWATASYIFNIVYQKEHDCSSGGTTTLSTVDPSSSTCIFQRSPRANSYYSPPANTNNSQSWILVVGIVLAVCVTVGAWQVYKNKEKIEINVLAGAGNPLD